MFRSRQIVLAGVAAAALPATLPARAACELKLGVVGGLSGATAQWGLALKAAVVVAPNDQGGTDIASVDVEIHKKNGIEASDEYYQRGTQNFAAIVTRILGRNPDAVDISSSPVL